MSQDEQIELIDKTIEALKKAKELLTPRPKEEKKLWEILAYASDNSPLTPLGIECYQKKALAAVEWVEGIADKLPRAQCGHWSKREGVILIEDLKHALREGL